MESDKIQNPFDNALAIQLEIHAWGTNKKVKGSEIGEVRAQDEATRVDKAQLSMSKKLVKCAEYDAIRKLDRGIRASLRLISIPSVLTDGAYLFAYKVVPRARELISTYREDRERAINAFLEKYEGDLLDQEKSRLGPLFQRNQYPGLEEVSDAFKVDVSYPSFRPDANLREIDEAAYDEALADNQRRMAEAAEKIQAAMRVGLLKLMENLGKALSKVRDDGKPGVFHESTVQNLKMWLEVFNDRNLTADTDLETVVGKCQKILDGVSADDLREDLDIRARVVEQVQAASGELDGLIKSAPIRRFSLNELPDLDGTGTD